MRPAFGERGYGRTTAAEIAAQVGVTERTFFRHVPDKRELLFDGEAVLRAALTHAVADAPTGLLPLDARFWAFRSVRALLEDNRPYAKPRHAVIARTPELYERDLAKTAARDDALAAAPRRRGVDGLRAALAARTGMAAFVRAVMCGLDDDGAGLGERLDRTFAETVALLAGATERSVGLGGRYPRHYQRHEDIRSASDDLHSGSGRRPTTQSRLHAVALVGSGSTAAPRRSAARAAG